jgi:hypothetical protein
MQMVTNVLEENFHIICNKELSKITKYVTRTILSPTLSSKSWDSSLSASHYGCNFFVSPHHNVSALLKCNMGIVSEVLSFLTDHDCWVLKIFYFVLRNYKSVFLLDVLILGSVLKHLANHSIELDRRGVGVEKEWGFRNCAREWDCKSNRGLSSHCSNL